MRTIRIGNYFEIPKIDHEQPAMVTRQEFYNFRNHVLRVLRVFGTAGPMGEVDLSVAEEDQPSFSSEIIDNPAFFVVDDMYNEQDRISIVECAPTNIDAVVIESLCAMMLMFPGWQVSFGLGDSGLSVFFDAVLVGGRRFWDCTSVLEVSERCQKPVDFGPSEPLPDSMNYLWRNIVIGSIDQTVQLPASTSKQWAEIVRTLEALRSQREGGRLTTFAYDQVRNDIHPQTRRQLLLRLLPDLRALSPETLVAAKWNIQQDSGKALADSASPVEASELTREIWSSLEATCGKFSQNEIVNWWADILCKVKEPSGWLKNVIEHEMRVRTNHSNPQIQLSALFGLATIHAADIMFLVEDVMRTRPEWKANLSIMNWLGKLRQGKTSYPDRSMLNPPSTLQ
ncbi:MAG: hypothetical protein WAL45_12610 [Terracidiphilus sp.]